MQNDQLSERSVYILYIYRQNPFHHESTMSNNVNSILLSLTVPMVGTICVSLYRKDV